MLGTNKGHMLTLTQLNIVHALAVLIIPAPKAHLVLTVGAQRVLDASHLLKILPKLPVCLPESQLLRMARRLGCPLGHTTPLPPRCATHSYQSVLCLWPVPFHSLGTKWIDNIAHTRCSMKRPWERGGKGGPEGW